MHKQKKWFNIVLLAFCFVVVGYLRHSLILHCNVALTNGSFEFSKEIFPRLLSALKSIPKLLPYLEIALQLFFLCTFTFLAYFFLPGFGFNKKHQKQYLIIIASFALASLVLTGVFSFFHFNEALFLSKMVFVKLQTPLPFLIYYLASKAKVL